MANRRYFDRLDKATVEWFAKKRWNALKFIKHYRNQEHNENGTDDSLLLFLADSLEMGGEGDSFYDVVVSTDKTFTIKIRLSNHPSKVETWRKHEGNGKPDIRFSVWIGRFKGDMSNKATSPQPRVYTVNDVVVIEYGFNSRFANTEWMKKKILDCLYYIYTIPQVFNYKTIWDWGNGKKSGAYKPRKKIKKSFVVTKK